MKKDRRILLEAVLLLCLLAVCFAVSCEPHIHSYVVKSDVPATCKAGGYTEYICTVCAHTKTKTTAKLEHTFVGGVCTECLAPQPSEGLSYTLSKDRKYYTVSGIGSCKDANLVIPSEYRGKPVKEIGYEAFENCTALISVTIPDSVEAIGDFAFSHCTSLASVMNADGVKTIGDYAFAYCDSLTGVTVGKSVLAIGFCAFRACASLTNITVDSENGLYKSVDGNLYSKDGQKLIQYAVGKSETSFTVPIGVKTVGNSAFGWCASLTSVTVPDSVTVIDDYALAYCASLTNVTLGNSLKTIGDSAFSHCTALTGVAIPNSARTIGYAAFSDCTALKNVTLGSGVEAVGSYAFLQCEALTSMTIPDSVKTIGSYAFYCCTSLASATVPGSVETIGISAFDGCTSLTIYCEAASQPSEWDSAWNPSGRLVVWNYKG